MATDIIARGMAAKALQTGGGGTVDTVDWSKVQNTPTTLQGYGITDAKIENETIILGEKTLTPVQKSYVDDAIVHLVTTLTIDGWVADGSTGSFKQTITIENAPITGYIYTVYPNSSQYKEWCEAVIYADDITIPNQITFHCSVKPTIELTANIKRERVVS